MPASTPTEVRVRFCSQIRDLLRDYDEMLLAVHEKRRQASLEIMLSEQAVMSLAVFWEAFLHDLMVSYVVRRPKSCLEDAEKRLRQSLAEKFLGITRWVELQFPSTLTEAQVERILDPKGWNVVATSSDALTRMANRYLSASDAKKFSLNADDSAFIDYLVSLRNYLGHRSSGARRQLLASLRGLQSGGENRDLMNSANRSIGVYLKRHTGNGTRINVIGNRIITIAEKLTRKNTP